ncbi:uncharacterized protein V6R79_020145 [Siganus canaliculatus]
MTTRRKHFKKLCKQESLCQKRKQKKDKTKTNPDSPCSMCSVFNEDWETAVATGASCRGLAAEVSPVSDRVDGDFQCRHLRKMDHLTIYQDFQAMANQRSDRYQDSTRRQPRIDQSVSRASGGRLSPALPRCFAADCNRVCESVCPTVCGIQWTQSGMNTGPLSLGHTSTSGKLF